jgi:hypothetical protein
MMEHFDGDECATYHPEFEFRVVGFPNPVIADDIHVGDIVKHPISGSLDEVISVFGQLGDGPVHLFVDDASAAQVTQAWRDACEGHETTRGAIGDTYYCDGACVGKGQWR